MPRPRLISSGGAFCLAMLLGLCVVFLLDPVPVQKARNAVFDQYQRLQPRAYQEVPVRVVDLDEESLKRIGQWPWPRTQVADMVQRLEQAGAAAVVFDVLFAEPDRTSPEQLLRGNLLPPTLATQLAALPDHDEQFAEVLKRSNVVLGFAAEQSPRDGGPPMSRFGLVQQGPSPLAFVPGFQGAARPLPQLEQAARGLGAMTFRPDADGVVRRVPLFVSLGGELRPSLVAEALRVAQRTGRYRIVSSEAGVQRVDIGRVQIPTAASGELWVYFTRPQASRSIPAWQVLDGSAPPVAGSIVLVGTSAQGLQDLRFSPLGGIIPGVEVHAQALEQVLTDTLLLRPGWATAVEGLALLLGGLILGLLGLYARALLSALLMLALVAVLNAAAWYGFVAHRMLLDLFTPSLGLLLVYGAASIVRHIAAEREQRWIQEAFSRYVSPNLVNHLVAHPEQLALGGQRQSCSFVFTDITGFTTMMERQKPEAAVSLLNDYLEQVIGIAFRHEGTLDRIVGDAVAIMFSAPIPQADHQRRALACALEINRFAQGYVAALAERGIAFGHTRIAVHSGEVVVGNFGGSVIFDYRALGDPVNTTSRLESLNGQVGTLLCVSSAIREHCPEVPMRPVGEVLLKGKAEAVAVFEPLEAMAVPMNDCDEDYEAAYHLLASRAPEALAAFEALAAQRPKDGLVAYHLQRLRSGEHGNRLVMASK
ncbi:adenylate/guanylate cyclase domain-containing protein [Pseudomonas straminea]|uniref:Adenylate cyclase n=1 Tax=Pseudomonas straminea TaxID=47882 RepID=A0A1I1XH62_PSEOC|nr:adenylate/guanylate cyclase domain-containing protein [Pseudomonas straminea]GLX15528.1 adenylate/guanylate cyclase domain-containing protein [Pseudomonas straminea]SFE06632.1 adenylate cyclase [Pseudomonas straminea]